VKRLWLWAALCLTSSAAAQTGRPKTEEWYLPTPDGCRIYVYEVGHGSDTVVVLNGGFGQDITYMLPAFDDIENRYRVIFYDPRGALRSACPDSLISLQKHVDDLDRLRTALRLDRMNIAGHSMGTVLAMTYLQQHPKNVKALALLGAIPAKSFPEDEGTTFASRMVEGRRKMTDRPEVLELLRREGLEKDTSRMTPQERAHAARIRLAAMAMYHVERWRQLRTFYNAAAGAAAGRGFPPTYDFTPAIAAHSCRVWILIGDHDYVDYGLPRHRRWIAEVPNARLAVIPNAGHVFWLDDPGLTRQYLLDALGPGAHCK
jgi:proline iminopeptidase